MSEPKSFASLSPSLLARKGAARPAMRPQLMPLTAEERKRMGFGSAALAHEPAAGYPSADADDLGWNDLGEDVAAPAPAHVTQAPAAQIVAIAADPLPEPAQPEVLRRIESLADVLKLPVEASPKRQRGTALKEGRKAAFTLRLDAARHLRLRLACTIDNRSAQQLVVEALDRFLEAKPGLEDLARRALRS